MVLVLHTAVLVLRFWCCFVKQDLVTLVIIMILEGHSNFLSTIYSFSVLCLEHHYCGDQQFTYLKLKSAKCLYLLPVVLVLVLLLWSWS